MLKTHIAESEWKIMQVLWREAPLYARDIFEKLTGSSWSEATIKTLLNRLVSKGTVRYKKVGKTYKYYPAVSEKQCRQTESRHFIDKIFNGSRKEFLTAFVQNTKLSSDEINELRKLLDEKGNG